MILNTSRQALKSRVIGTESSNACFLIDVHIMCLVFHRLIANIHSKILLGELAAVPQTTATK